MAAIARLAMPLLLVLACTRAPSAWGEVVQASGDAMVLSFSERVAAAPPEVYRAIGRVERWWSPNHTYSGNPGNLSLALEAGACFCERWSEGSVEHGRVLLALRDKAVRLDAALGPLQAKAVSAVLTLSLKGEGGGTLLTVSYRVGGGAASGLDKDAPAVDAVLGEQVRRLGRYAETGRPTPP